MRALFEFLNANPILYFILAAWIAGAIGNALRTRNQERRRAEMREARREGPAQQAGSSRPASPPPVPQQQPAGPSGPDDVAAEMRRILGLDTEPAPAAPPRAPEVMPRSEPIRREPLRRPATPELPPTPLSPAAAARMLETQIDPHVGERIAARRGPTSGRVGAHDREWGTLGGRRRETLVQLAGRPGGVDRLVDLDNLKRIIVGAEILGPPLALRDPDRQRMF